MADRAIDTRGAELYSTDAFVFPSRFRDDVEGILVPEGIVRMRTAKLAHDIMDDFSDRYPLVVPLLDGAADVHQMVFRNRHYTFQRTTKFLTAKSYEGTESTGRLHFPHPAQWDAILKELNGGSRPIILVEDIVDTGRTIGTIIERLTEEGVSRDRISLASMVSKPARRLPEYEDMHIDYLGFVIDDQFIVGAGLDFDENYRELPDICVLRPKVYEKLKSKRS